MHQLKMQTLAAISRNITQRPYFQFQREGRGVHVIPLFLYFATTLHKKVLTLFVFARERRVLEKSH